jgi:hypothetical protein
MDKVSQTNELSAIWAVRFANTSSSSVCSDSGTPQTRRISCLGNLYWVSYFSAEYERLYWVLDFRIIHSVQVRVGGSLISSSDTTRNGFVYINVALNILRSTICLINTATNLQPYFSSVQNTRQAFPYTVLLVDICTCSWKTIEFMLVSASESATSVAWYSRTLRMRRGPNTNICMTAKTWRPPESAWAPIEFEPYRNDEPWV